MISWDGDRQVNNNNNNNGGVRRRRRHPQVGGHGLLVQEEGDEAPHAEPARRDQSPGLDQHEDLDAQSHQLQQQQQHNDWIKSQNFDAASNFLLNQLKPFTRCLLVFYY